MLLAPLRQAPGRGAGELGSWGGGLEAHEGLDHKQRNQFGHLKEKCMPLQDRLYVVGGIDLFCDHLLFGYWFSAQGMVRRPFDQQGVEILGWGSYRGKQRICYRMSI